MVCDDGNQCFAMNFRHGTGIMHMDPRHGPLSDKSDPLLNFLATSLYISAKTRSSALTKAYLRSTNDRDAYSWTVIGRQGTR